MLWPYHHTRLQFQNHFNLSYHRSFRLFIVEGTDYASNSIGNLISGPLFVSIGYYGVFGLAAILILLALIYMVFYLKESVDLSKLRKINDSDGNNNSKSFLKIVKTSILYILEGVKTVVKKRDGYRRIFLFLGIFCYTCYIFVYSGTEGTTRIYYSQERFHSYSTN